MVQSIHLRRGFQTALKVAALQGLIGSALALLTLVWAGNAAALAAEWGMACAVLPTLYMALRVFLRSTGEAPQEILGAFYRAAVGRFVLTAVCLYFGAKWFPADFMVLMLGFIACLTAYWIGLGIIKLD